jgi:hypothetical protein
VQDPGHVEDTSPGYGFDDAGHPGVGGVPS